jgi:hypothetical protein
MFLALLLLIALLGSIWTFGVPYVRTFVPATWQSNMWAQVAFTGLFLLLTVWLAGVVVRTVGVKKAV